MPLIHLIIILVVVGVILWLINNYIPMDRKIKRILNVVVVICRDHMAIERLRGHRFAFGTSCREVRFCYRDNDTSQCQTVNVLVWAGWGHWVVCAPAMRAQRCS